MKEAFVPNLFVLGAAKCGTTTLCGYLGHVPEICISVPKEPFFFEREYERGLDYYREIYFPHWTGQPIVCDARARNLYLPFVPERIHAVNRDAKLVVLARNPIDRAYSHWQHLHRAGWESLDFDRAVRADIERIARGELLETPAERDLYYELSAPRPGAGPGWLRPVTYVEDGPGGFLDPHAASASRYRTYIDSGYYHTQIERYLAFFPRDRIHIVLLDDLRRDHQSALDALLEFVRPGLARAFDRRHDNRAVRMPIRRNSLPHRAYRRLGLHDSQLVAKLKPHALGMLDRLARLGGSPAVSRSTRARLIEHFRPHNERLAAMIGRDLDHWNA